tara:strand:- start:168251 stop:168472 length:222 start_codon:yes stop_codon:yes gene_type:complete
MLKKHHSQAVLPPAADAVEAIDVGQTSNIYPHATDRQAVHDAYERGNEAAAEKNEPPFDNRVGFATPPIGHER